MKKIVLMLMLSIVSLLAFEELTLENFEDKIKGKNVLLKFYAPWCPPCHILEANMKEIDQKKHDVVIYSVNIDNQMDLAHKFGINVLPTTVFVKDGMVVSTEAGVYSAGELREKIKELF